MGKDESIPVNIVADEYLTPVMEEVTLECAKIFAGKMTEREHKALSCFLVTMGRITAKLFEWLPPAEVEVVASACGAYFDVGVLFGKSPELLVEILDRVSPRMQEAELPGWLSSRFYPAADKEEE